jgi:hypothetical protein
MGTPTKVYANHFPTKVASDLMLYQYDVLVEKVNFRSPDTWDESLSRDQRRKYVQLLAENNQFDFIHW